MHSARDKMIRSNWKQRASPVVLGAQTVVALVTALLFIAIIGSNDPDLRWKVRSRCYVSS